MEKRKIDPEFGLFMYKIISESNLTNEKIADILGCSVTAVGYYCSGQRKPNQRKLLVHLRALGLLNISIPF